MPMQGHAHAGMSSLATAVHGIMSPMPMPSISSMHIWNLSKLAWAWELMLPMDMELMLELMLELMHACHEHRAFAAMEQASGPCPCKAMAMLASAPCPLQPMAS